MLVKGQECIERDVANVEAERHDRTVRHLRRQAKQFNLELVGCAAWKREQNQRVEGLFHRKIAQGSP